MSFIITLLNPPYQTFHHENTQPKLIQYIIATIKVVGHDPSDVLTGQHWQQQKSNRKEDALWEEDNGVLATPSVIITTILALKIHSNHRDIRVGGAG